MKAKFDDWRNDEGELYISKVEYVNEKSQITMTVCPTSAQTFEDDFEIDEAINKAQRITIIGGGLYTGNTCKEILETYRQ